MATERSFQKAYLAALKAVVKEKRQASGGLKLSAHERHSAKFAAQQKAEEHELRESGAVVKSIERKPKYGYVVATDSFMSGWGHAPRTSYYAVAVDTKREMEIVIQNMTSRSEMKRVRFQTELPRVKRGQHLHVVGKRQAKRFFEIGEGGFKPDKKQLRNVVFANYGPYFREGYEACEKGQSESVNPYRQKKSNSYEYAANLWAEGWHYCKNIMGVEQGA
jgi:hypothetical protein